MEEHPLRTIASNKRGSERRLKGFIAGMIDGHIISFDYQGLQVRRDGESVMVFNPESGEQLGGRILLESATLPGFEQWLDNKAEHYVNIQ